MTPKGGTPEGTPQKLFWGIKKGVQKPRKTLEKVPIKSPHIFCAKYVLKLT